MEQGRCIIVDIRGGGKGDLYDHSMDTRIFNLIMDKMFIWVLRIMKESDNGLDLVVLTISKS